ncbi:MAG: hypothetical protein NTZ05_16095, partial [Chloroflexi bacterium]|nr:hypothetical protein [Chloroflexota bacterium]
MLRLMMPILAVVLLLVALPFNAAANQRQTPGDAASVQGALTAPQPRIPPDGSHLSNIGPITLQWDAPAGTTQYQLQVIPFNGDGPGINLIRNADSQYTIPAPPTWFVILPGMTYSWQVRVTDKTSFAGEGDPSWSPWSPSWRFATPLPNSDTIRPTQPQLGTTATSQNPTLVWTDVNPAIFYYQIQLSSDPLFNTDPFTATAAVYWNLVHGGETAPQNSWAVPSSARLDTSTRYYWRVRPRVQGDGAPINWGQAFWFMTQGDVNTGKPTNPDLTVTDLQVSESTVAAGGLVRVLYTVKNQGVGTSSPVETHAVLSPDCAITRVKQDLGLIDSVGPLMGGQSATSQTLTVTVPMNQPVGAYCLGV